MSNISVTTTQSVIAVTDTSGITVTTPEGQTIDVTVPNSSVNVTNTTDDITILTAGTLNINSSGVITSVNGDTGPVVVLDTDDISEGTTNKYFSQALARQSLSAGTGISYDSGTGVITNTSINTDTTYTIDATTATGGANFNLVGSDSSTDTIKIASGTNITVSRTDANTITIDGSDLNTTYTIASASTTGGANLNLVGSDSTTDSVAYKGSGATTVTSTDANTITIASTDTNTTYTQNASSTSGGANLNLVGSDSTTDSIKLASGTNVTVTRTDADTVTFSSTDTNTTYTIASGATSGGANLTLTGSDSSTDSVAYLGSGATTVTSTDANTVTISSTDTNTTYTQNASSISGGANLNLVGSDSTTDSVAYLGSGATTVTRTDANTITVSSTDTNTTYTQNISSTTGGANLNLVGSDSTTDTVKFANGTGVTVAYTDADTATISIGQSVGTGDSPSFAGGTFGNITVGVDTDNTIGTTDTNGNIILDPNGTGNIALTLANGGNLTNTRNYVYGAIRNTTSGTTNTATNGDHWSFTNATGGAYRGITLDNSVDTTKRTGITMRSYGISGGAPRNAIIGENARGTAASPSNVLSSGGDRLLELFGSGYVVGGGTSAYTGWPTDSVANVPAIVRIVPAEDWNDGLNKVGTRFQVILTPPSTPFTTGSSITVLNAATDLFQTNSNQHNFKNAAGNNNLTIDSSGNVVVTGDLTVTGNDIKSSSATALTLSGTDVTVVGDLTVTGGNVSLNNGTSNIIDWSANGTGAPAFTTRTAGTKAVLYPSIGGSTVDYALGIDAATMWSSVPENNDSFKFKWYGAETEVASLSGIGNLQIDGDLTVTGNDINSSSATAITLSGADVTVVGDLAVNGGDITTTQTTASVFNTTATTLNIGGGATLATNIGTANGSIVKGPNRFTSPTINAFTGSVSSSRGLSISNANGSSAALARNAIVVRTYPTSGGARGQVLFENARGTENVPSALVSGDFLGETSVSGYATNGWVSDYVSAVPGVTYFTPTETWSNTGGPYPTAGTVKAGTGYVVALQPADIALTSSNGTRVNVLNVNPQTFDSRSDQFSWSKGKTNNASMMNLSDQSGKVTLSVTQNRATSGSDFPITNFTAQRSTDGVNYTATQSGDNLGSFKFNGNAYTGTSPGVPGGPGAEIIASATEPWTSTANGTQFNFFAMKTGTIDSYKVFGGNPDSFSINSNALYLNNYTGTTPLNSGNINYSRTYGEFCYTNASGFGFAAADTIYTMPIDTTNFSNNTSTSNTSRININSVGKFKIIMSLQSSMTTNNIGSFRFWLRKNGTDVANSATEVDLLKDQKSVIAMDWMVDCDGSDYWEIAYATSSVHYADIDFPTIAAQSTPYVCPLAPAVIFNVIPIGA